MDSPCPITPGGSEAIRPAMPMPTCWFGPETLNPRPMLPAPSIAALPIQRQLESGAYVDCWKTNGSPAGPRISYQRTPPEESVATLWFTTRDSYGPMLRYAARYIIRSPSPSSTGPPCWGTQDPKRPPLQSCWKGAPATTTESIELFFGVTQSTWKR